MTNVMPMARERRPLTAEELAAAETLARAMAEAKLGPEQIAQKLDITAGAVRHWSTGIIPVPMARALELAKLLNADPNAISVAYRIAAKKFIQGATASQLPRLTGPMLAGAYRMARTAVEAAGMSDFDPEHEPEDAALLALALEDVLENGLTAISDGDVLRFVVKAGGQRDAGRSSGQDGGVGRSAGKEEAGKKARVAGGRGGRR